MTYLLRDYQGGITLRPDLSVFYEEIRRDTGRALGGVFRVVEGTGKYDKRTLNFVGGSTVRATAEGVKSTARVLREREAAELAAIDETIERLQRDLQAAKQIRSAARRNAFTKGNVVRLQEAIAIADANLAKREARNTE